jgi:hypothetical protein
MSRRLILIGCLHPSEQTYKRCMAVLGMVCNIQDPVLLLQCLQSLRLRMKKLSHCKVQAPTSYPDDPLDLMANFSNLFTDAYGADTMPVPSKLNEFDLQQRLRVTPARRSWGMPSAPPPQLQLMASSNLVQPAVYHQQHSFQQMYANQHQQQHYNAPPPQAALLPSPAQASPQHQEQQASPHFHMQQQQQLYMQQQQASPQHYAQQQQASPQHYAQQQQASPQQYSQQQQAAPQLQEEEQASPQHNTQQQQATPPQLLQQQNQASPQQDKQQHLGMPEDSTPSSATSTPTPSRTGSFVAAPDKEQTESAGAPGSSSDAPPKPDLRAMLEGLQQVAKKARQQPQQQQPNLQQQQKQQQQQQHQQPKQPAAVNGRRRVTGKRPANCMSEAPPQGNAAASSGATASGADAQISGLPTGWRKEKKQRSNGGVYWYYYSPKGERFDSWIKVQRHLGLA